jgi:hypothetical protein
VIEMRVRVWVDNNYGVQHWAPPPKADTAREWAGSTVCDLRGTLRWVTLENVDAASTCERCAALEGHSVPLQGEYMGPV